MPVDIEEDVRYADMSLYDLLQNYKVLVLKNGTIVLVDRLEYADSESLGGSPIPGSQLIVEGTLIRFEHTFPRWGKYPKVSLSVACSDIMHISVGIRTDLEEDKNER